MKRAIALAAALLFFGSLFATGSHVSADGTCENIYLLTVDGKADASFTFQNANGRYEAFADGDGGWWVGDYRTGALTFATTIRYYDGNGNLARARNNGNGTVTIQDSSGNVVRSTSLTVDGSSGGGTNASIVAIDVEQAIQMMKWWLAKQRGYTNNSWATCS